MKWIEPLVASSSQLLKNPMVPPDLTQNPRQSPADPHDEHEVVLMARPGWVAIDWQELIRARELLFFLTWRDVKIRYKQTVLGAGWAVLQPLFTMLVSVVVFGYIAGMNQKMTAGVPYAVFVFAGLIPWTFFSNGVSAAALCLLNQQHLITKVYFPRLFVPTSTIGALLIDMAITLVLYAVILACYQFTPSWQVVFLPLVVLLTIAATLGLGIILATVTLQYRDFRYLVAFFIQILMFLSPVMIPTTAVPARYQWIAALNPMYGIIQAYRSSILGAPWEFGPLAISIATTLAMVVFGLFYFRKTERRFADIA